MGFTQLAVVLVYKSTFVTAVKQCLSRQLVCNWPKINVTRSIYFISFRYADGITVVISGVA